MAESIWGDYSSPLYPRLLSVFSKVLAYHQRCGRSFANVARRLLRAACPDVSGREYALDVGLKGCVGRYEPILVKINDVANEIHVRIQADEDEDRAWSKLFGFARYRVLDHHRARLAISFELLDRCVEPDLHLGMA